MSTRKIHAGVLALLLAGFLAVPIHAAPIKDVCHLLYGNLPLGPTLHVRAAELNQGRATRSLNEIQNFKIVGYNVLNLIESPGRYIEGPNGRRMWQAGTLEKPVEQLQGVVRALKDMNGDIAVITETDGLSALGTVSRDYLGDEYMPLLIPGNDGRGIDIGFLVKRDLPINIELISHKNLSWREPGATESSLLFSRDAPVLLVKNANTDEPFMAVIGTHNKSQRDAKGDPGSIIQRTAQAAAQADLVKKLREKLGERVMIVQTGDFNKHIPGNPEFDSLLAVGMDDAFNLLKNPPPLSERFSHSFHPHGGETSYSQLDGMFVYRQDAGLVRDVSIYQYRDKNGNVMPLPTTFAQRELQPSDHLPIQMTLDFQALMKRFK